MGELTVVPHRTEQQSEDCIELLEGVLEYAREYGMRSVSIFTIDLDGSVRCSSNVDQNDKERFVGVMEMHKAAACNQLWSDD